MDDQSILPKAKVFFIRQYAKDTAVTFEYLKNHLNWTSDGKTSRMFCNIGSDYLMLGQLLHAEPFDPLVFKIMQGLNDEFNVTMNACYASYYPDGEATLPFRQNSGLQTDLDQPIMSIAYGGARRGTFRDIETLEEFDVYLGDGDLSILSQNSQKYYLHGLRASTEFTEPRISLSFRHVNSWSAD